MLLTGYGAILQEILQIVSKVATPKHSPKKMHGSENWRQESTSSMKIIDCNAVLNAS